VDSYDFYDKGPSLPRQESKLDLWIAADRLGPEDADATRVQWVAAAPRRSALLASCCRIEAPTRDKSPNRKCGFVVLCVATLLVLVD
jgi:hypothetical protein